MVKDPYSDKEYRRTVERPAGPVLSEPQEPILQFFGYAHLPSHLQSVSAQFHRMAHEIVSILPRNPERTVALRKLLEAKDAAVRAALFQS